MKYLYDDYILSLAEKIDAKLKSIRAVYNFELGAEFELAICELLIEFLPEKYGVCRGFVVDKNGIHAGDDIIVFDKQNFPTLRGLNNNFTKKEKVPIEAVYAYFEAKHSLDIDVTNIKSSFNKALQQVGEVKRLILTREKYGLSQNDAYHVFSNPDKIPKHIYPSRNPVFTMIISNNVTYGGKKIESDSVTQHLNSFICMAKIDESFPEGIVVGENHYLSTSLYGMHCSRFVLPEQNNQYFLINQQSLSLAIGIVHLYSAIDFIRLGRMPWEEIFNNAKNIPI
jgi:hypothetical protein